MCAYLPAGSPDHSMAFDRASITKEEAPTSPIAIHKVPWCNFITHIKKAFFLYTLSVPLFLVQSIRKKSVTMQHSPSAVFHYSDTGGHSSHMHHCKVNAIFQAAKKDLLKIFQLQVRPHFIY